MVIEHPWPRLPQGEPKEYDAKESTVKKAQEEAAREVLDKVPMEKILDFAGTIQYVNVLGRTLGKVVHDEKEDATVLDAMIGRIADNPGLITGYALGRIEATNPEWVVDQVERMKVQGNYSPEACALLYLGLPEGAGTWSAVGGQGEEVERAYWKRAHGYSRANETQDAAIAIEKLLDVRRPAAALDIAGDPNISIPSSLLKRLLQELLELNPEEKKLNAGVMDAYRLGYVFKQLYERKELPIEEIAKLEWPFASLFDDLRHYTSSPLAIHHLLQKDPFFLPSL